LVVDAVIMIGSYGGAPSQAINVRQFRNAWQQLLAAETAVDEDEDFDDVLDIGYDSVTVAQRRSHCN
jgi:hypothetical protein